MSALLQCYRAIMATVLPGLLRLCVSMTPDAAPVDALGKPTAQSCRSADSLPPWGAMTSPAAGIEILSPQTMGSQHRKQASLQSLKESRRTGAHCLLRRGLSTCPAIRRQPGLCLQPQLTLRLDEREVASQAARVDEASA